MRYRKMVLTVVLVAVIMAFGFSPVAAEPVLIKLTLEEPADWTNSVSLGVVAFHRFDNFVLADFERTKLYQLDEVGLKYQIVDENPWWGEYFLTFPEAGFGKVSLDPYGEILLEEPGWYLIKASRGRAFQLMEKGYRVIPIQRREIPLAYEPPIKMTRTVSEYSADIDSLVDLVSSDSLYAWDLRLQNFQTRYSYSDSIHSARLWLYEKLKSFGIDSVWFHHYYYDSHQYNVVATVLGTATPDRVIVVGGHYDSVVYGTGTDPYSWAPGADDDGSGTVATLEMARIIAQNPLPVTVIFVPFAQEEQGLFGSDYFAQYLFHENTNVALMINSDMIGHSVDLDPDVDIRGTSSAMPFVNIMMELANTYTNLDPFYGGTWVSDDLSFYQWGYHSVGTIEGDFHNAGWHTNYDLVDSLDFGYMREVVKMCLATLLLAGKSPSMVEDLAALDAGDGDAIYLSWSANHPGENVIYYNLYFGTSSGDYDSVRQISATADTLRDLEENTTYFMAVTATNVNGFESLTHQEISMAPREIPRPPSGLTANPFETYKIKLNWSPNREADLDYYNIYRSEQSGSGYQLLAGAYSDTSFVDSSVQGEVEYYYYTLTAVDTCGNESQMSDEAQAAAVTLDQGILVVDETYDNISYNFVDSDSINAFYQRALQNYTYAYADHSCPNCIPENQVHLKELGRYEVVIIHSEDNRGNRSLGDNDDFSYSVLKDYLSYEGKVIIEGRRNLSEGNDGDWDIREFSPGEVPYDYLKIESAYVPPWSPSNRSEEFIGAFSQIAGYPDLQVDSLRVAQCSYGLELEGRVPGVGYIDSLMGGEVIYTFHSDYDTSASEDKPVAFRYTGGEHEVIFFDFPLYFIQESQATELLHKALSDLGMFPTSVEDEERGAISSFSLKQNVPNPFNSETIIRYSLPLECQVEVAIYNILGQRVRTLFEGDQTAGYKHVIWDGKNEKGKTVSSGIYFYRIKAEEFVRTRKMLLLK